jgi:hypothetical protein
VQKNHIYCAKLIRLVGCRVHTRKRKQTKAKEELTWRCNGREKVYLSIFFPGRTVLALAQLIMINACNTNSCYYLYGPFGSLD